jgi:hypothetical protein
MEVVATTEAESLRRVAQAIAESLFDREVMPELSPDVRECLTLVARDAVVSQIVEHLLARRP